MAVKRTYDGTRRAAAVRATKREVVEAARQLFVDQGYPATTVGQIAERSGVPQATLYRLFPNKRAILKMLVDVTLGGDDEDIEFRQRTEVQEAFAMADPAEMLRAFAGVLRRLMDRSAAMQQVLATSAVVDREAAEMLDVVRQQRHTGQGRIVQELARRNALPAGLTPEAATDIVYTLMSPEVHRILTVERAWSADQYEEWLADAMTRLLLR
jgi:AcrR family transcriptional regulator